MAQKHYNIPQEGHGVDHSDSTALKQPEEYIIKMDVSEGDLSDNRNLVVNFLGTTSGAIIGWQIGMEITGKKKIDRFPLAIAAGLIVAAIPVIEGDKLSLSVRTVYGDYKMGEMKRTLMQSSPKINNIDLPYSATDNFPANVGYEIAFSGAINKWCIGTKVGYRTTGGRFGYKDSTDEVYFENRLKMFEIAEFVKYSVVKTRILNITLGLNVGAGRIMETRKTKIALSDGDLENYVNKSTSLNLILGPELMSSLLITKQLNMEVFGGYDRHIFTGLNAEVNNFPEQAGNTDWSGVRLGLGVAWVFNNN